MSIAAAMAHREFVVHSEAKAPGPARSESLVSCVPWGSALILPGAFEKPPTQGTRSASRRTCLNATSTCRRPIGSLQVTSRTSRRRMAGCTSPSCWTCTRDAWWAGPCPTASTPSWRCPRCAGPPPHGLWSPTGSTTRVGTAGTEVTTTSPLSSNSAREPELQASSQLVSLSDCGFRGMAITHFGAWRSLISVDRDHPFRRADHPFRASRSL